MSIGFTLIMTLQTQNPAESGALLLIVGPFIGIYAARRAQGKGSFVQLSPWAIVLGAAVGTLLLDLINLAADLRSGLDALMALGRWVGHGLGGGLFIGAPAAVIASYSRRHQSSGPRGAVNGTIIEQLRYRTDLLREEKWRPLIWCPLLIGTTIAIAFGGDVRTFGAYAFTNAAVGFVLGAVVGLGIQVLVIVVPIVLAPFVTDALRIALWALSALGIGVFFLWLATQPLFWILVGGIVTGGFLLAVLLAKMFARRERDRAA